MGFSKAFEAAKIQDLQDVIPYTDSVPKTGLNCFFIQIYRINGKSMLRVYMLDLLHNSLI